jgi:hypothetical protein
MTAPLTPVPLLPFPPAPTAWPIPYGLQFKDVAPMICSVVDNGVCEDDPRVMVRLNEATKIVLDNMIPVGGMASANVAAYVYLGNSFIILPPQMENVITVQIFDPATKVWGSNDVAQGWSEIVSNSIYVDPEQQYDNPLLDQGLNGSDTDPTDVRRVYVYPGLQPPDATVQVTGARRYQPITNDEDYPIVQNVEALKCIILSIERYENNALTEAQAYRKEGLDLLQAEVKKHLLDPRRHMYRKA